MSDARAIADANNLKVFMFGGVGVSNILMDQAYQGYMFLSPTSNTKEAPAIDGQGQSINISKFQGLNIVGNFDGRNYYTDCTINVGTYDGHFERCDVVGGVTFVGGGGNNFTSFRNCTFRFNPSINFVNVTNVGYNWIYGGSGELTISNMAAAGIDFKIDGFNGTVAIDASCTAGTITIRGGVTVIDNSAGATVVDESDRTFFFRKVLTIAKWLGLR
jgi:hypothetical protein